MSMTLSNNTPPRTASTNNTSRQQQQQQQQPQQPRLRSNSVTLQKQQFPVPVSVQIYNLFAGPFFLRPLDETKLRNARLDYSTELLRPIQAELVVVLPRHRSIKNNSDTKKDTKVLYVFPLDDTSDCTISPCWSHLQEALDWDEIDRTQYEQIHMRFRLADKSVSSSSSSSSSSSYPTAAAAAVDGDEGGTNPYFLQIPLHPSRLVPLEREPPPNRPINTVLVHFSDETVRITPQIYEQLKHEPLAVADEQLLRFEEDAFQALDSVVSHSSPASLLDAAEEFENFNRTPLILHTTSTENAIDLSPSPGFVEERVLEEMSHLEPASSALITELMKERDAWRNRIQTETVAVQAAKQAWDADQTCVRDALKVICTKEEHILQIEKATREEQLKCQKLELHLEAQRIRLVKELRRIYPITTAEGSPKVCKIRGLVLPRDLFSIPEDDLSASLGFLCHATTLLSRYLSVPLRYRLYCNSSRSAVQDDRGTVFPLFQARPVEREQVEHGVVLLERNLECIGRSRGIQWENDKSTLHILDKVNTIYESVIEGDKSNK